MIVQIEHIIVIWKINKSLIDYLAKQTILCKWSNHLMFENDVWINNIMVGVTVLNRSA